MEGLRSPLSLQGIPGPSGPPGTKGLPGEPVSAFSLLPLCLFVLAGWSQIGRPPRGVGRGVTQGERLESDYAGADGTGRGGCSEPWQGSSGAPA